MVASQAVDLGSIPRCRIHIFFQSVPLEFHTHLSCANGEMQSSNVLFYKFISILEYILIHL